MSTPHIKVLFLCTGNSSRSQMAEAWTRRLYADVIDAYSAGVEPKGIDPRAIQVMREKGIDISSRQSKSVDVWVHTHFDYVITLCDHAKESCPLFPGKTRILHVGFEDPPSLAANAASEKEALAHYRRIRDEIHCFIEGLPDFLESYAREETD